MFVSRYRPVVYLQIFFILIDIFVNTSSSFLLRKSKVVTLVAFVIQDVCMILALIVLFLVFFNTFVFQAGLVFLLIRKFKVTILTILLYFALSVVLHIITMRRTSNFEINFIWTDALQALYTLQRIGSITYYFSYKRAILKLAHPKYYRDTEWLRKEFDHVQ
ncbi:transmembrane protein 138 isoform X2 [Hydra vulgaris]|uniref:Transmembrane protein 138 n=1 Tax=Hydra vulgaris TaxID=6087 RepID=A0ABM4D6W9_HYDVU